MDQEHRPVEIKDLNKTQLILLAILLSFVISIATGIVTVTLMQQAPTGVTQTINRVVQQTIEKVVPDYTPGKTQTVVVKEDDLVVDAVAKARAGIFPIFTSKDAASSIADAYSLGGGLFLASSATFDAAHTYTAKVGDVFVDIKVTASSPLGFSLLSIADPKVATKDLPKIVFGKDADVKPGQTAVIVSLESVSKGTVQSVSMIDPKDKTAGNTIEIAPSPTAHSDGALAVNLDGSAIGLVIVQSDSTYGVLGVDAISKFIANPTSTKPAPVQPTTPPVTPSPTDTTPPAAN